MNTIKMLTLITAMLASTMTFAHDGTGPHGGRLADTGTHHLELIVTNNTVDVFISTKASATIPTTNLTGLAIVVNDGASIRIPLTGDGTKLSGKATTKLANGTRSVVQVKLTDGQMIQASFN